MPSSNTKPWYLTDMTESLYLDPVSGEVAIRTGITGNINISGPVTIPGTVTVNSTDADPVHVHVSEIGTSGILAVPYMPIGGNVIVTTIPPITGNVNASVNGTVGIAGNISGITALPPITGNVNANVTGNVGIIGNIAGITALPPITGNVNAAVSGTVGIAGNIAGITALPPITGTVGIAGNIAGITALPPITGNVNANVTGNVGITGNVNVTQGTTPWAVSGNVNATLIGDPTVNVNGLNLDAFARLRVSNPFTFFDSALSGERRYDWSSATATGGTVTFDFNANVRKLNVTAASGSEVVRESIWCFPYQPGKSLLVMSSFCMSPSKTGLRQRVGYFGSNNGIYFEQVNTTKNMVIRSSSSGSLVEERISQSNWNTDKLDGTGPSGLTLDTAATQIFWTDIEWLGVGTVRTGFVINGQFIICHKFNHANDPAFTTTYMGSATLPCRYEITNTGATSGVSTMKQICTTVISEGGYTASTQVFTAGTGITVKRLASQGTYYPIASIRLNSSHLNSIVRLEQTDMLSPTVNYYRWVILKNATLTGATWASSSSTTRVDVDTASTAVTGGTELESGYISSRETASLRLDNIYGQLSRTIDGVSDTFTLAMTATSNNADVLAQIGWQEII